MLVPETSDLITFRRRRQITGLLEVERPTRERTSNNRWDSLPRPWKLVVQVRRIEVACGQCGQQRNEQFGAEHNPTGDGRNPQFDMRTDRRQPPKNVRAA